MRYAEYNLTILNQLVESPFEVRLIQEPLSEADILYLEDTFLTNGLHHIKVNNIQAGRSILYTFLKMLPMYHDVACLTLGDDIPLEQSITDLYQELVNGLYLDPLSDQTLEDFFYDRFYFDFMWIETTKELIETSWFSHFEQKINDLRVTKHIPIVAISYESKS